MLFRYWNVAVYGLCEITIEILWEWEVLANLGDFSKENGYDVTTRGICICMVLRAQSQMQRPDVPACVPCSVHTAQGVAHCACFSSSRIGCTGAQR